MNSPESNFPKRNRDVLLLLWFFAFLSYLLRVNISVAQQYMAHELSLNTAQIGYVFSAFLIGYTIFQVPAGMLGDRFGPPLVLALSGLCWSATTLFTGLVPGLVLKGAALSLASLLVLRFLHGLGEAATYPVAMTAVTIWFPVSQHALVNSLIFTGSTLGAAFAPPLVAHIMNALGWRATFYLTAILPLIAAVLWWRRTRTLSGSLGSSVRRPNTAFDWRLLANRNIFFLCLSYLLYCYAISLFVFWLFKYLVDVRHLSIVNSGWAASLPWMAATVSLPLMGLVVTRASLAFGILRGRRLIATICLVIAAALMFIGARAESIAVALTAIAFSVGLLFSTESPYFSTAIDLAPEDAGAASGMMNLAGNLGGVLSTLLVPVLVTHVGWVRALISGSVFALAAAACWFVISPSATMRARYPNAQQPK